ncbi:hypothetical protein DFA_00175 [Cavenderia fasciculata]|uniref:Dolichyldiphosphatase n=1 Tax=Cavenderia fasciculata TaxID=261658 RepID=F4PXT7_CACFS|nr:uncharacterized protein DFA_00175 [Cavenderia fasciculata]EGG19597.1 hypothetical protein DFA_00175 [Cavenderia fasciculata]|eukprot:XP_004357891.1 hypothetical protein DFA_00175 [Cavenderia fasciculata]
MTEGVPYQGACRRDSDLIICIPQGQSVTFTVVLMAIYSYIPILLFVVLVIWYLWRRSIIAATVLASLIIALIFNEGIIKNIVKQKRPIESCACSYGMPSGHSLCSTLLLFWICYEFIYVPMDKTLTKQKRILYIALATVIFGVGHTYTVPAAIITDTIDIEMEQSGDDGSLAFRVGEALSVHEDGSKSQSIVTIDSNDWQHHSADQEENTNDMDRAI